MKKNTLSTNTNPTPPADPLKLGHNLRVKDLAPRIGMSVNSIWRLSREGKLPKPFKLSEKVTVWKAADVLAWLEEKGAA
jgi:prophage regulatory protein